jgi:hypothetical protein
MTERVALSSHEGWVPHCPDFLWRHVALIHFMRLSLMKGAHADLSSRAWQEIGAMGHPSLVTDRDLTRGAVRNAG